VKPLDVRRLGRVPYQDALALQRALAGLALGQGGFARGGLLVLEAHRTGRSALRLAVLGVVVRHLVTPTAFAARR